MKNFIYAVILLFPLTGNHKANNSDSIEDFPNSVGDRFTYRVTDSINNKTFNVDVSIAGKSTLANGQPVNVWTYSYPNSIDTNYVFCDKNSVIFYDHQKVNITNVYHFPLSIGAKWKVSFDNDTSTVMNNDNISVNGKTYNHVFLIHEKGRSHNYRMRRDQWVAANIGLIKMTYALSNLGYAEHRTWELISYHLK